MLGTFHLSPILKVISVLQLGPWKFQKLQSSPFSSTSGQLLYWLCRRRVAAPPTALGRLPAPPLARAGFHASPRNSTAAFAPRRALSSPCHAVRGPPPAATSTPPWTARVRAHRSSLSRITALHIPPQANPSVLLPFPSPQTPERFRHPLGRRRAQARRRTAPPQPLHPH